MAASWPASRGSPASSPSPMQRPVEVQKPVPHVESRVQSCRHVPALQ
jgi:hypothetical protein